MDIAVHRMVLNRRHLARRLLVQVSISLVKLAEMGARCFHEVEVTIRFMVIMCERSLQVLAHGALHSGEETFRCLSCLLGLGVAMVISPAFWVS